MLREVDWFILNLNWMFGSDWIICSRHPKFRSVTHSIYELDAINARADRQQSSEGTNNRNPFAMYGLEKMTGYFCRPQILGQKWSSIKILQEVILEKGIFLLLINITVSCYHILRFNALGHQSNVCEA